VRIATSISARFLAAIIVNAPTKRGSGFPLPLPKQNAGSAGRRRNAGYSAGSGDGSTDT
jgi:hypothetical protein